MFPGLTLAYWLTMHGLVTALSVLVYAITAHVMQQRRHPTAAIAWVLFILLVPYVALPTFLTFGSRKQTRPRIDPLRRPPEPSDGGGWAIRTILALGQPAPAAYEALHVHADGRAALAALLETIDGATRTIDVCTFILAPGPFGRRITERLAARARDGVRVRLLLDGLGRFMGGWSDLSPLKRAGVEVSIFVPPLHSPLAGRTNLRNHRKMLIADAGDAAERRLWCGGRNLAPEYFEGSGGDDDDAPPWHDLSFDVHGPLVEQAAALFEHDWQFANGGKPDIGAHPVGEPTVGNRTSVFERTAAKRPTERVPSAVEGVRSAAAVVSSSAGGCDAEPMFTGAAREPIEAVRRFAWLPAAGAAGIGAQLIASGPDQIDDTIYSLLVTASYRAQRRIALITPYFVPDSALLQALCLAARRGVDVDLLIPGRSNHLMSDVARRRALRTLAAAGGQIWLAPQMLHAKLAVVDDSLALAGSANLDSRSLFLNYELMFAFHDLPAIDTFARWFDRERATAQRCTPRRANFLRDVGEGLVLWVGFQL